MNSSKIKKPLTVAREEFINTIVETCNNSNLPFFVVEEVLRQLINNVSETAKKQYELDKARYEKAVEKEQEEIKAKEITDEK